MKRLNVVHRYVVAQHIVASSNYSTSHRDRLVEATESFAIYTSVHNKKALSQLLLTIKHTGSCSLTQNMRLFYLDLSEKSLYGDLSDCPILKKKEKK